MKIESFNSFDIEHDLVLKVEGNSFGIELYICKWESVNKYNKTLLRIEASPMEAIILSEKLVKATVQSSKSTKSIVLRGGRRIAKLLSKEI